MRKTLSAPLSASREPERDQASEKEVVLAQGSEVSLIITDYNISSCDEQKRRLVTVTFIFFLCQTFTEQHTRFQKRNCQISSNRTVFGSPTNELKSVLQPGSPPSIESARSR